MKKIVALFAVFAIAITLVFTTFIYRNDTSYNAPSETNVLLGIQQIHRWLQEGYELQYDNLQTSTSPSTSEAILTNPKILNPLDLSMKWMHDGVITIGQDKTKKSVWIQTQGTTSFNHEQYEIAITSPIRVTLQTKGDLFAFMFSKENLLPGSISPNRIVDFFQNVTISIGKGAIEYKSGSSTITLADYEDLQLEIIKESNDAQHINLSFNQKTQNLHFPESSEETLLSLSPPLGKWENDYFLCSLHELGMVNYSMTGTAALPSFEVLRKLFSGDRQQTPYRELVDQLFQSGYSLNIKTTENSNRLYQGKGHLSIAIQKQNNWNTIQFLVDNQRTFSSLYRDTLVKAMQQISSSLKNESISDNPGVQKIILFLNAKNKELQELIPDLTTLGNIHNVIDIAVRCKEDIPEQVDFLLSLSVTDPGHGVTVRGNITGLEEAYTKKDFSLAQGKVTVALSQYKRVIDNVSSFYNTCATLYQEMFPTETVVTISPEQAEYAKKYLQYISDHPENDSEDIEITLDLTDRNNPKVGTLPLFMGLMGPPR